MHPKLYDLKGKHFGLLKHVLETTLRENVLICLSSQICENVQKYNKRNRLPILSEKKMLLLNFTFLFIYFFKFLLTLFSL